MGPIALRVFALVCLASTTWLANAQGVRDALTGARLGLYDAAEFRLVDGRCADCRTVPQAPLHCRR